MTSDNKYLISGSWDKNVIIWNFKTLEYQILIEHSDAVSYVTVNNNNSLIASASWDKSIKIWTLNDK